MKRSLGGFLIIVGIIVSTYAFSAYNLYTATDPASETGTSPAHPLFYLFFAMSAVSVLAGVTMISTDEHDATE